MGYNKPTASWQDPKSQMIPDDEMTMINEDQLKEYYIN
jgi:hypothetical protein